MTFSVPDELAAQFLASVPSRKRSQTIAILIASELEKREAEIVEACHRANADPVLEAEMTEWQGFDDPIEEESNW